MARLPMAVGLAWMALLSSACGAEADAGPAADAEPRAGDPEQVGPFAVGVTTLEAPDPAGDRPLPLTVWYPARAPAGAAPAEYQLEIGVLVLATLESPLGAVREAPLDERGAPYPVVVFSHGNGGLAIQSLYLTEHLASHGFVVVSPDHVGNTFETQVNQSLALPAAEVAKLRPLDVTRSLDALFEASAGAGTVLSGSADVERVGAAGHSFGGYTTLRVAGGLADPQGFTDLCAGGDGGLLCDGWEPGFQLPALARDPRVRAALPQAPGGAAAFAPGGFAAITIPTMIQAGSTDEVTPAAAEAEAPYAELGGPAWLVVVEDAGHFTFSNMCLLVDMLGLTIEDFDDGCGDANVDAAIAHRLINRYATAFFQHTIAGRGDFAALLTPGAAPPAGLTRFDAR
ncbi:MAG: hypothetical protein IT376_20470 [Polyangiaceae bacterium]|nr:hypothetical protein [Polyangiaceae bacterium]